MSRVLVLDQHKRPLMPCTPARARLLLKQHKAAVFRRYPFTLILRDARPDAIVQLLRIKIDPGSHTTGLRLQQRAAVRRGRRLRHTRYRQPRFRNRRRPKGWLPPSLISRIQNVETWVRRLMRWCPMGALSYEAVRFDTQALQQPEIAGTDYQHGTLAGYELKEYLLLKWGHQCAYCLTPVTGHHLSGEQSPTFYGNESMLNVLLAR
jgi:hypothetical protein